MPPFTSHLFICGNQRPVGHPRGCCDPTGTDELRNAFKQQLKSRGLGPLVRANGAGCLEQCEFGPTVVIYPQGIWYGRVQIADVPRIIEETLLQGHVLEDLLIPAACLNNGQCAVRRQSDPATCGSCGNTQNEA